MAISTYAELKSAIADWLNRDDLTSVIPSFIELAEAELTRNLRHRKMVTRADATIDEEYTQTPDDWFQTQTLILETDPVTELTYLTPDALNEKRAASTANGKPLFYNDWDRNSSVPSAVRRLYRRDGLLRQDTAIN